MAIDIHHTNIVAGLDREELRKALESAFDKRSQGGTDERSSAVLAFDVVCKFFAELVPLDVREHAPDESVGSRSTPADEEECLTYDERRVVRERILKLEQERLVLEEKHRQELDRVSGAVARRDVTIRSLEEHLVARQIPTDPTSDDLMALCELKVGIRRELAEGKLVTDRDVAAREFAWFRERYTTARQSAGEPRLPQARATKVVYGYTKLSLAVVPDDVWGSRGGFDTEAELRGVERKTGQRPVRVTIVAESLVDEDQLIQSSASRADQVIPSSARESVGKSDPRRRQKMCSCMTGYPCPWHRKDRM